MPDTTPPAPSSLTWIHTDSRGLAVGSAAAYARALAKRWSTDADSIADLRTLVAASFANVASLGPTPPIQDASALVVHPNRSTDNAQAQAWQDALVQGLGVLLGTPGTRYALSSSVRIETEDGAPASEPEAGLTFLVAVVLVAVVGAIAAVVTDWLDQKNQIEATKLATDAHVQEHTATLASANQIIEAHLQREQLSGQSVEWDTEELNQLERLRASTTALVAWKAPELRPGPIASGVAGAVSNVGAGIGGAAKKAGSGVEIALALLVAYLVFKDNRKERRAAIAA